MRIALIANYPNRAEYVENLINLSTKKHNTQISDIRTFDIYKNPVFPKTDEFDKFIFSGGALGVYEKRKYPYIVPTIDFAKKLIDKDTDVLGICYGHQLIAEALGGKVYKADHVEIGYKEINVHKEDPLFKDIPCQFNSFEFHKDAILSPPEDISVLASSSGCQIEALRYNNIVSVQFHPEIPFDIAIKVYRNQEKNLKINKLNIDELIKDSIEKYNEDISTKLMYNFLTGGF